MIVEFPIDRQLTESYIYKSSIISLQKVHMALFNLTLLLQIILPTITSTLALSLALTCLLRLKSAKHRLEIWSIIFICMTVALWSFNTLFFELSWKASKAVSLSVVFSMLNYAHIIILSKNKKLLATILRVSIVFLVLVLFLPGITMEKYSLLFSLCIFPQVLWINLQLFRRYKSQKIEFNLIVGSLASVMIGFGMYETARVLFSLPDLHGPLIGSIAYVASGWYLIVERGYFNTKTWTDYIIEVVEKEKLLEKQNIILSEANKSTITILTQTIEAKDPYTRGHCLRVRTYSKALGQALGLKGERLQFLEYAALLHDIGKILIPGKILNKESSLNAEEYEIIKKHPLSGAEILKNVDYFKSIIPIIRHHHESFDGKGYPDGLAGNNIPLEARILSVSDTYDALTSDRPYRKALRSNDAIGILEKNAGSQLDSNIVRIFIANRLQELSHPENGLIFSGA
jgi:putative nucleotidyltransferase with HDIG domain